MAKHPLENRVLLRRLKAKLKTDISIFFPEAALETFPKLMIARKMRQLIAEAQLLLAPPARIERRTGRR
jgi:hypothetical protein